MNERAAFPVGSILLTGPDGSGKTTVAEAIVAAAQSLGIPARHAHYRPTVLAGHATDTPVDPHGRPPRGLLGAVVKILVVLCDHAIGWLGPWRRAAKSGLLVIERGWADQIVDPRRYRLPASAIRMLRALNRLLPRTDLVILLGGDAETLSGRKTELSAKETARQLAEWRVQAQRAGRLVCEVDGLASPPDQTAKRALASLTSVSWREAPLAPRRLDLRVTAGKGALAALRMYQPFRLHAIIAAEVNRRLLAAGLARKTQAPVADIAELSRTVGDHPDGILSFRSGRGERIVLGMTAQGALKAVVKVGEPGDDRLRTEHEMLQMLSEVKEAGFLVPDVSWWGEWNGHLVLATDVQPDASAMGILDREVLLDLCIELARGPGHLPPVVHGDLTPWNILLRGDCLVLLDWESSRLGTEPMFDLTHFIVQEGALLRRFRPAEAVETLSGTGSLGARYLKALGEDVDAAASYVTSYLRHSLRHEDDKGKRYRQRMLDYLT